MHITVQYSAQARQAAGAASERVELAGPCSVRDMLFLLAQKHGEALRRIILTAQGEPQPALLLFVDDEQVDPTCSRPLQAGDVLCILPPVAGGQNQKSEVRSQRSEVRKSEVRN